MASHSGLPPLVTGALFGAALLLATVHTPSIILSQLRLQSTHMLKAYLTASSASALIIYASNKFGAKLPHRTNTSYGWFGSYDANLIGGILQGLSMALTGACPGTVLVQLALGYESARYVALGGVLGGAAFVAAGNKLKRSRTTVAQDGSVKDNAVKSHTIMQKLQVSEERAVLVYETLLISAIAFVDKAGLSKNRDDVLFDPVRGGMLIGLAQAMSVLLSKKTLGISSAYAELASKIFALAKGNASAGGMSNIIFALGVMAGTKLTSFYVSTIQDSEVHISVLQSMFGGFVGIFGARMAGGCTSGHGISGMSTLSISSFVTVAGMFGGGIAVRLMLDTLSS